MWLTGSLHAVKSDGQFVVVFLDLSVALVMWIISHLASSTPPFAPCAFSSWLVWTHLLFSCSLTDLKERAALWADIGLDSLLAFIASLGDLIRSLGFECHQMPMT